VEGTPFGRYRLVELLGRGGMGEVWRAHDTVTDRVVAIKVLPAHLSGDEDFQRRFRREAHAAARLDTPHVVPIYDYGEIDGRLFVSMRLINGRDLATVLADGPVDPARAVRIIDQVAKALHAAHKVGLMHRDIKPSNILLDDDDFAYLIDFGIARVADDTRMTKTGSTIGTFAYIAPERLDPHTEEDARADIYSLACVLYEALTGEPPFPGSTTAHLMFAHAHTPPPRPSTTQPGVPAPFDEVIAKGMAKAPDNRYATTVELADAARDAITGPSRVAFAGPIPSAPAPTLPDDQLPPPPRPPHQGRVNAAPAPPPMPTPHFRPPIHQPAQPASPQPAWAQPVSPQPAWAQPGWGQPPSAPPTSRPSREVRPVAADRAYLIFLALLPFIVGSLSILVPGNSGLSFTNFSRNAPDEAAQILVLLNAGAVFMGTALTFRPRAIFRREQAVGRSTSAYVLLKIAVFCGLAIVQSAIATAIVVAIKGAPAWGALVIPNATLELIVTVAATCVASACLGLALSTLAGSNEKIVPVLLASAVVLQLALSGGLIPVTGRAGLDQLSWLVPSRWGYAASASTVDLLVLEFGPQMPQDPKWDHSVGTWIFDMAMLTILSVVYSGIVWLRAKFPRR
jgi:serine/threonine protein kinase